MTTLPAITDEQLVFPFAEPISKEKALVEFCDTFGASSDPEVILRCLREEVDECAEALAHTLKEMADIEYVCAWAKVKGVTEMPQDLAQDLHVMWQYMNTVFHPAILDEAFRRVHESNMSKLGDDGKPLYRDDGKVLKGPNYKLPNMIELI